MSHTIVIREVLVNGVPECGDVRIFHNADFSGESTLQTIGPDRRVYRVPLDERSARLIAAAPRLLELLINEMSRREPADHRFDCGPSDGVFCEACQLVAELGTKP